jgi:hypothetical protein
MAALPVNVCHRHIATVDVERVDLDTETDTTAGLCSD